MGDDCATGVASPATRPPAKTFFYGEYLVNAQGEDVVAGVRTPSRFWKCRTIPSLAPPTRSWKKSEKRWKKTSATCMDFEFTIEKKKLYMLQTRQWQAHCPGLRENRSRHGPRTL